MKREKLSTHWQHGIKQVCDERCTSFNSNFSTHEIGSGMPYKVTVC